MNPSLALIISIAALPGAQSAERPIKAFILAGQSNMEGKA